MIDSIGTLHMMGLSDEIDEIEIWLRDNFVFPDAYVSVFETNIRILGGFISAFDLTGKDLFLELAK